MLRARVKAAIEESHRERERDGHREKDKNRRFLRDIFRMVVTAVVHVMARAHEYYQLRNRLHDNYLYVLFLFVCPEVKTACLR